MKNLIGCQRDFTVFIKYQPDLLIKGGIPTIVLVNPDCSWLDAMSPQMREWFDVNVTTVMINDKFY